MTAIASRHLVVSRCQRPKIKASHLSAADWNRDYFRRHICCPAHESIAQQRSVTARASQAAAYGDGATRNGISFAGAVFSVLNITCGVGLLSVPLCFSKSGYAGVVVLWLLGAICAYTAKALCRCADTVSKILKKAPDEMVRYEEIAEVAFGSVGRKVVSLTMYTELVGTCALFLILESDNVWNLLGPSLQSAAAQMTGQFGFVSQFLSTHQGVFWLTSGMIVATTLAPDVKALASFGVVGFAATMCVTAAIAWTLLSGDFVGGTTALINWSSMPLIFGILAFCYSGHSVFPSVRGSMSRPQDFPAVLNVAFTIVAALSSFLGLAGYFMYGSGVADVITFNLKNGTLKTLCAAMILVNPIAKFAITQEPCALAMRKATAKRMQVPETYWFRSVVNVTVAMGIVAVARFLPFLSIVMSFVGALMTMSISIIIPAAANYALHKQQMSSTELVWVGCVLLTGAFCALSGTASALLALKGVLGQ